MSAGESESVAGGLIRLSSLVQSVFAQTAAKHGLTSAQGRLLCVLAAGPVQMSALATMLAAEKAALTGLVDRAEARALVARTPVPGDRRALSVALTPAGRRLATAFHQDVSATLDELAAALPRDEQQSLRRSLARLTASSPGQWPD